MFSTIQLSMETKLGTLTRHWMVNHCNLSILFIIWINSYGSYASIMINDVEPEISFSIEQDQIRRLFSPLPCKLYNTSKLDCSKRDLSHFPPIPPFVTAIDFNDHNLTAVPALSFDNHPELLHLDFTSGNIHCLDRDAFVGIGSLTTLILLDNKIPLLLAGVFRELTNLQVLDLSLNLLTTFPNQALQPLLSLVELNLSFNNISDFNPNEYMTHLVKLRKLVMTGQSYSNGEETWITQNVKLGGILVSTPNILRNYSFQNLPHLTEIDWLFNPIIAADSGALTPLENLSTLLIDCSGYHTIKSIHSNLTTLSIRCIDYDNIVIDQLAPNRVLGNQSLSGLARFDFLSSLSLSINLQSIDNGAFIWFTSLTKLDLNGNSVRSISPLAFDGLQYLEELDLSFNSLRRLPSDAFQVFRHLKVLNLDNNGLSVISPRHPMPFGSSTWMEKLILSNNEITEQTLPDHPFSSLPSLRILDLSHNKLGGVVSWMPLTKLEELYIDNNNNELTDALVWNTSMPSLKIISIKDAPRFTNVWDWELPYLAPNLQNFIYTGPDMPIHSFSYLDRLQNIKLLDLSKNEIESLQIFNIDIYTNGLTSSWSLTLSNLEVLILSENKLSYLTNGTFEASPLIIELDLSENIIKDIDLLVFTPLTQLARLDLSSNKLTSLSSMVNLPALKSVSVSNNNVFEIPKDFLSTNYVLQMLDLSGNRLVCSCKGISTFQHWILTDNQAVLTPGFYLCSDPEEYQGAVITEVPLNCYNYLFVYIISGVVVLLVVSVMVLLAGKYRWHISYKFFLVFRRYRYTSYIDDIECISSASPQREDPQFDIFVSYNEENEDWILGKLQPNMENVDNPVRLFIGARDLPLGECILDATVHVINECRRTLLVLSPSYMDDEWRYFEMQMAQQRLFQEGRDVLVLVLLEDIPDEKLTMLMRQMLCQKSYLKWPNDIFGQDLFWQNLKDKLRRPTRADRINEV